jgi:hypothetical protein
MDATVTDLPKEPKRPRGRQLGSHVAPGLKRTSSLRPRDLVAIDKHSAAARFYDKMVRDVRNDLGGRREITRIEGELINAFCASATLLAYYNHQVALGEAIGEIDVTSFSTLASTLLRIGSRLGTTRRPKPIVGLHDHGGLLEQLHEQTTERESDDGVSDDIPA